MNKIASLIRIAILFALGMFAATFLFGEEKGENESMWMLCIIFDKALSAGLMFIIAKLYNRWRKIDPWFIAYDRMCNDSINQSNRT
ncbi:MAG: hypothetical protein HDS04_09110 [Bacteroides sp.]|nr:hypothetical protein [Bacteroides sp.]